MNIGDYVIPISRNKNPKEIIGVSRIVRDLRDVPYARCFQAKSWDTGIVFGITESTHRVMTDWEWESFMSMVWEDIEMDFNYWQLVKTMEE